MSIHTATSQLGWSGRGVTADISGVTAPLTPASDAWSSPVTRISTGPFIGHSRSPANEFTF
jgi:hypothetical protein